MNFVYTDQSGVEAGIITAYDLDMAWGKDENDFSFSVPVDFDIKKGCRIFCPGTEYGGIVRGSALDKLSSYPTKKINGVTWHGLLSQRIIQPESGRDYFSVSGDANKCIGDVLDAIGLSGVFEVAPDIGTTISYQFERYINAWDGLNKMLTKNGLRPIIEAESPVPTISATPCRFLIDDGSTNGLGYKIEIGTPVNHLICLGKGDLAQRTVIHLFADESGSVSTSQTLFGLDEVQDTYDGSNQEDSTLLENGIKRLLSLQGDNASISLPDGDSFAIGDVVGVRDYKTGLFISATVSKVILKVRDGVATTTNEIGEVTWAFI